MAETGVTIRVPYRTIPYLVKDARPGLSTHGAAAFLTFPSAPDGTARRVVLVLTADSGDRVAPETRLPAALPLLSVEEEATGDDMASTLSPPTAEGEGNTAPPAQGARLPAAPPPRLSSEKTAIGDMAWTLFHPTGEGGGNTSSPNPPPTQETLLTPLSRLSTGEAGGGDMARALLPTADGERKAAFLIPPPTLGARPSIKESGAFPSRCVGFSVAFSS